MTSNPAKVSSLQIKTINFDLKTEILKIQGLLA